MCGLAIHPPIPPVPYDGEVDQVTFQVFEAMGRLFHLHRQAMQRCLSSPGAHHGEVISLRLIATREGMSQKDLADTLHLSRPRVTRILQGLEKAGAIRRQVDPDDQRITRVFLTAEGHRREMGNRAAFEEYIQQTIGSMSEGDKLELTRLLNDVSAHIAALVYPGSPEHDEPNRSTFEQEVRTS